MRLLAVLWLLATLLACGDDVARARPWSLVVLPDTQVYSLEHPQIFRAQLEWIAQAREPLEVRFVAHVGDVTETNAESQWRLARSSFALLDGAVPYAIAPGNHDYALAATRESGLSRWFPAEEMARSPTFGGLFEPGRSDNVFHHFTVDGERFLVLVLEWGPRDAALAWAREVLAAHRDHQVIVVTHAFLYNDDTRYDWAQRGATQQWNPHAYEAGPRWAGPGELNDGQQIWDKLIDDFDNVRLVVSGHVAEHGVGRLTSVTSAGGRVHQLLANFQGEALGGGGYLRILRFVDDELEVRTYSPYLGQELLSPEHSFVLEL